MALFPLKLFPENSKIDFIGKKWVCLVTSIIMIIGTFALVAVRGLNFGIDFTGGILIDAKFEKPFELAKMRTLLKDASIGDVSLQTFGKENDVLIRIGQAADDAEGRVVLVNKVKQVLAANFEGAIDYRKVDYVGPKVGKELIKTGSLSLFLACIAILIYVWFRFEWQYGIGAIIALIHDAVLTVGFFSVTQLEFNLSSIAAILTIIGYSINDSVVIFDRIRENIRKFKKLGMDEIINLSTNETLSRTTLTSGTTLMAILCLVIFGGEVIKSFSLATMFGIVVGTYSSIYISAPVLIFMKFKNADNK